MSWVPPHRALIIRLDAVDFGAFECEAVAKDGSGIGIEKQIVCFVRFLCDNRMSLIFPEAGNNFYSHTTLIFLLLMSNRLRSTAFCNWTHLSRNCRGVMMLGK